MRFKKLAVPTGNPAAPWTAIYNTMRGLALHGYSEGVELNVDLIDKDEPGCYYAWLEAGGMLQYVRPSVTEVHAALGIERAGDPAQGRIVRVRLTAVQAPEATVVNEERASGNSSYSTAVQNALRIAA